MVFRGGEAAPDSVVDDLVEAGAASSMKRLDRSYDIVVERRLPDAVRTRVPASCQLRIPMRARSRSLNLSNAVAVAVYEAWRQLGFPTAEPTGQVQT